MRVALQKIDGVTTVAVSLNEGYAEIALAPANAVTVEQVRETIRANGFTPREARVRVRGTVDQRGDALVLHAAGGPFRLAGPEDILAGLAGVSGGSAVTVEGLVPATADGQDRPRALHVIRFAPAGSDSR